MKFGNIRKGRKNGNAPDSASTVSHTVSARVIAATSLHMLQYEVNRGKLISKFIFP